MLNVGARGGGQIGRGSTMRVMSWGDWALAFTAGVSAGLLFGYWALVREERKLGEIWRAMAEDEACHQCRLRPDARLRGVRGDARDGRRGLAQRESKG